MILFDRALSIIAWASVVVSVVLTGLILYLNL